MTSDASASRRDSYQRSFRKHGDSPRALKWKSYGAAAQRFRQLTSDVDISGKTILDAGCGMGDLVPFLYGRATRFDYLGVDITPEFIETARRRYDSCRFEVFDPFEDTLPQTFDIVFSSGVMNASTPDWPTARHDMIRKLFGYSDEALVFNMAGWPGESREVGNMGYAHLPDIFAFCLTLTPRVIVRNHYNSQDFTIALFK